MKPSLKNIKKRTPKRLKAFGDFCLLMIPTLQASFATAPEGLFTAHEQWLITFTATSALVCIKFVTKLFTDEEEGAE